MAYAGTGLAGKGSYRDPVPCLLRAQSDALLLARAALQAGLVEQASQRALAGVGRWTSYRLRGSRGGVQFRTCDLLLPAWALYVQAGRWEELLLVHPSVIDYLTETVGHRQLMTRVRELGPGLFELASALDVLLSGALSAPDSLDVI